MILSVKQYKMLKRINKAGIYEYTNCSEDSKEVIHYLADNGCIRYFSDKNETFSSKKKLCKISQKGEAALYEWKVDKIYRLVPTYLAIFAAIGGYRKELALIIQVLKKLLKL